MKKSAWLKIVILTLVLVFTATLSFSADPKAPVKPTPAAKPAVTQPAKAELIDINTATKAELSALPGIGDVYSQKIIDGRPYAKKDQLKSKKIIPGATYDKIKDKIIAKQAPKKK
jgi:DNA uptake protein ComE-like DNA-binding protein